MIEKDKIIPKLENLAIECEEIESVITAIEDGLSSGYGKFDTYMPAFEVVKKKAKQLGHDLIYTTEDIKDVLKEQTESEAKPINRAV